MVWQLILRRDAHDWEILPACNLLERVGNVCFQPDQMDCRIWSVEPGSIVDEILLDSSADLNILWKEIWYNAVPLKVQFFLWVSSLGKISTMDILIRKGMILPNIFLLCYREGESIYHILIQCPFIMDIWSAMLKDFGLSWVIPPNLVALLSSWKT